MLAAWSEVVQRQWERALFRVEQRCVFANGLPLMGVPSRREAEGQDVWLTTADGCRLHARYFPCPADIAPTWGLPSARPTVLFFHGAGGDVVRWRYVAPRWQDALGADLLLLDYRGYGRSSGEPTERGLALDSRAAYRWLRDERGVRPAQLLLVGQSLGGAVATELATAVDHAGLVLESTFTTLAEVADSLTGGLVPLSRLLSLRFPTRDRLRGYRQPLFLSHGTADRLIPVAHAPKLADAAEGPKALVLVGGMGHPDSRRPAYGRQVREFLQPLLAGGDSAGGGAGPSGGIASASIDSAAVVAAAADSPRIMIP